MQTRAATPEIDYIVRTFVREPQGMDVVRSEGERRRPGMQVSLYEGKLLHFLVRISGATSILEIGTFMGYSTLWMAEALPEGGRITTHEFDADTAAQANRHFAASPHAHKITALHGDAHAWIRAQKKEPQFDFVFIDAEKKGYADYLDEVLPLLRPGAFVVGDNSLLFGQMAQPADTKNAAQQSMRKFNTALADPQRFDSILLTTPEGLTVARFNS